MKYKRILLKVSGEALLGEQQFGIAPEPVTMIANEIKKVVDMCAEVAVVVGGGNILRGMKNSTKIGLDRATGDYVGMLATVMNAITLQSALTQIGVSCRAQTAIAMNQIANDLGNSLPSKSDVESVFRRLDSNNDGLIDFNEFKVLMRDVFMALAKRIS